MRVGGLAVTEGKILGKPQIVSDFASAREQVTDDKNGVILPLNNFENYQQLAYKIVNNKQIYTAVAQQFDYEPINKLAVQQWKQILDKERSHFYDNRD